jgi:hypothetical protein
MMKHSSVRNIVTRAKAGIQGRRHNRGPLNSRVRGNDVSGC